VYPVPDSVGDQVMAALVLRDGATITPEAFEEFLAAQPDLSPKAWPRYVWIAEDLPSTATNKILKRELVCHGTRPPGGLLWKRDGSRFLPQERAVSGRDR
jgi:fatty-acyl-CoA synthase